MPITLERSIKSRTKGSLMIDIFKGIDKSTARHRIFGDGAVLYESKNTFPYLQGRLQRRKDYVTTNSRDSDNAFPSFPDTGAGGHTGADALTGNPTVKAVAEFNNSICIFFEDDGDRGKLMMDAFDVGNNTIDAKIVQSDGFTFTGGAKFDTTLYAFGTPVVSYLLFASDDAAVLKINPSWTVSQLESGTTKGQVEVFLQAVWVLREFNKLSRTNAGAAVYTTSYEVSEAEGEVIKLITFGYQTSSAGAFTNLIIFKRTSTWLITGLTAEAAFEQLSGNVGLAGKNAIVLTPFGVIFVGRDKRGFLNIYLLDRVSLTLHTIGHPLYEVLQLIPKANYEDIFVSYDRNRLIRIALTQTGDSNTNEQEYWIDFYNGIKKRTFWGPFPLKVQSLDHAIAFSGGATPVDAGFFFLELSGTTYSIKEETETDSFDSSDTDIDVQSIRTKLFDFGTKNALINMILITALDNGAKFKIYSEIPKAGGTDDDTTQTLIGSGNASPTPVTGEYQMGTTGLYKTIPVRLIPALRVNQFGIKIDSDADVTDDDPLEISQIGFEYTSTQRIIIE